MHNFKSATLPHARALRVLHVEDSEDDAELLNHELARAGFAVTAVRVETAEAMRGVLGHQSFDIVISDFNLPRFSTEEVLGILADLRSDLPCIIVSGAIGEEAAVALMRAGAADFVMKQRLSRLGQTIERCLRESDMRRAHLQISAALAASEARFEALASSLPVVVFQTLFHQDGGMSVVFVSEGSRAVLGIEPEDLQNDPGQLVDLIVAEDRESFLRSREQSAKSLAPCNWEGRVRVPGVGDVKWVNLRASTRRLPSGAVLSEGIMTNITESKVAQESIHRSREQLRQLSSHVERVKEEERAHIAREIHDDLGATLTAAKIDLAFIRNRLPRDSAELRQKTSEMEALLDEAIDTSRRLSQRLRPLILDHGISAAIEWQAKDFSRRTGIACQLMCASDDLQLNPELSTALFRVFQETLTNITRHSGATRVEVGLVADSQTVVLTVRDNGRGLKAPDINKPGSYGLRSMRERVEYLGGEIEINSDAGTRIEVHIPVNPPLPGLTPGNTLPGQPDFTENARIAEATDR
jgi:two-component system, NarL family, sensor histidine kinase UhpB